MGWNPGGQRPPISSAPSHRCRGVPEGEPSCLSIESFSPSTFRHSASLVPQNVREKASPRGSWLRSRLKGQGWNPGGQRPPFPLPALSPLRGALPEGEPACLPFSSFFPGIFCRLASYVPCAVDEPTRPLRGRPSSTRKGGALYHAFLFPHMFLKGVVQDFSTRTGFSTSPVYIPHIYSALPQQRHLP